MGWDDYFLGIAEAVAGRSTCPRLKVGCVITRNNRILSTGYNGAAPGKEHCTDIGCKLMDGHCIRTIHAESNALMQLSQSVITDLKMYTNYKPCDLCLCEAKGYQIKDENMIWMYPYGD